LAWGRRQHQSRTKDPRRPRKIHVQLIDEPTYRILAVAARLEELRINRRLAHLGLTQGSLEALESVADLEPAKVSDLEVLM
jgi:hypothetical protein